MDEDVERLNGIVHAQFWERQRYETDARLQFLNLYTLVEDDTVGTSLANFGTRGLHNIAWARFVTVGA